MEVVGFWLSGLFLNNAVSCSICFCGLNKVVWFELWLSISFRGQNKVVWFELCIISIYLCLKPLVVPVAHLKLDVIKLLVFIENDMFFHMRSLVLSPHKESQRYCSQHICFSLCAWKN
jgi:hypothetical protein